MQQRQLISAASAATTLMLAICCAWPAGPVQAAQAQAGGQTQPSSASEQNAATQRQTRKTDQANRAAAVEDETSAAAQAARTAQSETAQYEAQARRSGSSGSSRVSSGSSGSSGASGGTSSGSSSGAPSYGPTLAPRAQPPRDPVRKDPAEVHDETDSLTRPAPAQSDPAASQRQTTNPNLRRPAWQPATQPMAPRPLRSADAGTNLGANPGANLADPAAVVPVPPPVQAVSPRAVGPTRSVIVGCQGNSCTDTSGQRYNGIGTGNAGVNSSGRLCTRTGISVQCF
jgi:hypothetical protein